MKELLRATESEKTLRGLLSNAENVVLQIRGSMERSEQSRIVGEGLIRSLVNTVNLLNSEIRNCRETMMAMLASVGRVNQERSQLAARLAVCSCGLNGLYPGGGVDGADGGAEMVCCFIIGFYGTFIVWVVAWYCKECYF